MKVNAIKLNHSYFIPGNGSKLSTFRGDYQASSPLPAQGQDVVQLKEKTAPASGETSDQNNSSGSTVHKMFNSLKHFFTTEPNLDIDFNDLDMVIYRSLTY